MNKIKEIITSKSFLVNYNILKYVINLNITLEEFLLLLYFINVKEQLDTANIKEILNMDDDKTLSTFDSLIKKAIIEIKVIKKESKIEEVISLEPFFNKLSFFEEPKEEKNDDIFGMFEKEFGRTLSPIEYETINNWIENNVNKELITYALKEAVLNGVTSLRYVDKIIFEKSKKNSSNKKEFTPLFDYDWLSDNNEK